MDAWLQGIATVGFPIFAAAALLWVLIMRPFPRQSEIDDLKADKQELQSQVASFRTQYDTLIFPTLQETMHTLKEVTIAAKSQQEVLKRLDDMSRRVEIELAKRN